MHNIDVIGNIASGCGLGTDHGIFYVSSTAVRRGQ